MLPFALVLLFASSALAHPTVLVTQADINSVAPARDNGRLVSSYVTDGIFELIDGGDTSVYGVNLEQVINDIANQPDDYAKALSLAQNIAVVGVLGAGVPGDSCEAAAAIDAYVSRSNSGAVRNFINRLSSYLNTIVQLSINPSSLRYANGVKGNCPGGGRTYQFEAAWDSILDNASPYNIGLINEEYCVAKRLYNAFSIRSNNIGSAVTAASLKPVVEHLKPHIGPISNLLKAIIAGRNPVQLLAEVQRALRG